ncbi:MAG: fibronectin type III domain-containing protein [Pseudodesulfovibrio sp.]
MRLISAICALLLFAQFALFGCALGKKEWPSAQESQDSFDLELIIGERNENCLVLEIAVAGAVDRLYRASIQYEIVGGDSGGCDGCPFVPRDAVHFTRNQKEFLMNGNNLTLSLCDLEPGTEYRFRVAGKSELPTTPLVYTDVFVTTP